jgi:hypothetical protein
MSGLETQGEPLTGSPEEHTPVWPLCRVGPGKWRPSDRTSPTGARLPPLQCVAGAMAFPALQQAPQRTERQMRLGDLDGVCLPPGRWVGHLLHAHSVADLLCAAGAFLARGSDVGYHESRESLLSCYERSERILSLCPAWYPSETLYLE